MIEGLAPFLQTHSLLTVLLICHFLSDFHFQSPEIADQKDTSLRYLAYHILGVAAPLIILTCLIPKLWLITFLIVASHSLIDLCKSKVIKLFQWKQGWIFLLDQFIHIMIIVYASIILTPNPLPQWLSHRSLLVILFLILITKPTNISFKIFFSKYQPEQGQKMDTIRGAGATIGILERIVIGICMIMGQFASIGLVFTAKSIARYNKISESPAFAEYYLIGSLFSILSVFLAAWICFF
ncbi:cytochrome bd biosynthesis ABC transporter ATPase and permease [Streptococcus porcinus]|uniref:DUF3307 domain-containing protein n=1 Tax=Streptococcus porcinus TaxID=1340 RepID=UPI0010CABFBD|nr:DUF3307 domain-containing protein [Streptococcus porcinus]VTS27711.1 cytochrome bd biosynthesis ABC transporter ATPase and permease [Streptococcus porcinus]